MRIELTHDHPAKVGDLLDLLTTEAGLAQLPAGLLGDARVIGGPGHGDLARVEWTRSFDLPRSETRDRLVSDTVQVTTTVDWKADGRGADGRGATGRITTRICGAPVRAEATHRLEPGGDGCRSTLEVELTCSVPMLGGRLLDMVARHTRDEVDHFLDALDGALAAQPC